MAQIETKNASVAEIASSPNRLREEFGGHVAKWKNDTENSSVLAIRFIHPSYMRIVGMGSVAIPWILSELKSEPDWWFEALKAVSGVDPAQNCDNFDSAVTAWLQWGTSNGYNA